ncbi:MAG: hypothetical protein Q8O11_05515, partial [Syntrophales bacterium]|nr:hypothetical protein [Syntrophales bacterium]
AAHVRVACGLDYLETAPIRGLRRGGGEETMEVRLKVDDADERTVDVLNIAIANGRYHGGGMLVAPDAEPDDGLFLVTVIGAMSLPLVFWHLPKLYTGKIKVISQVSMQTGKRVTASSEQRVLLDIDGEQPGTLPADLEIVPSALKMIMLNSKK